MAYELIKQIEQHNTTLMESYVSDIDWDKLQQPERIYGLDADQHDGYKRMVSKLDRNNKYHNIIAQRILSGN